MRRTRKVDWRVLRAIMAAVAAAISGGLSTEAIASALKGEAFFDTPVAVLFFAVFLLAFWWLYRERRTFLATRLYWHEVDPHRALIVLLTLPNIIPQKTNGSFPWVLEKGDTKVILKGESLENEANDPNLEKLRWNWQQLMRGILPHVGTLRVVYLLGSDGSGSGSFRYLDDAEGLIKQYLPEVSVRRFGRPVDFEGDFEGLVDCLNQCVQEIQWEYRIHEKDIVIDVTGGQKTASIAGAMVTLNTRVTFQYVSTTDPRKVRAYDVTLESPISL
uniref:Uncharacterized protein n=1 Tax=Candidatus Caldatribacterium saccharofermentans TaxID=1454753 RepID=A0A7V4TZV3_9BACT